MRVIKRLVEGLHTLIEQHKAIRRFIILTLFPIWLYLSYTLLMHPRVDLTYPVVQIYAVFTGVVGTAIGFYFVNRQSNEKTVHRTFEQDLTKDVLSTAVDSVKSKVNDFSDINVSPRGDE